MKRWRLLALVLPAVMTLSQGCVTTSGTPQYPPATLPPAPLGPSTAQPSDAPPAPADSKPSVTVTVTELLERRVEREFPARVLVLPLGYPRRNLDDTVTRAIEQAVKADPVLKSAELFFGGATGRWGRNDRSRPEELQMLAARFQARYVLAYDYEFNVANRTYWLPACIVLGTLGLIPMPVGGETIYCTTEFVMMDVPSGLFLVSARGRGQDQRTAVWGWMFETGGDKPGEQQALKAALEEAVPHLMNQVRRFFEPSPRP